MIEYAFIFMLIFTGLILLLYKRLWISRERLRLDLQEELFRGRSLSSKYGKMTEQFLPFLDSYPYDKQNFRFIGSPIDGVQFEKDRIIFVEFKSAGSRLSEGQKNIKETVEKGRVEFREFRIDDKNK